MDLVVQIQHLHHFTNGGHFKKWMAAFDFKFFVFQAGNPGDSISTDFSVLLQQFSGCEIFGFFLL